ncbi:uncharacterized protein LOC115725865 [Rhodamnia argentea]|uniref:Uncharacterized protein LOC115725865 n=1 Tax=Rhodamnia argentea TaxID=178133 RepID=A0ABM3HGD4_9MYRT|nr:uncharacterized protein LOC115725865 [Rhodamnia argentea]
MGNIRSKPESIGQWRSHRSRARASFPTQACDSDPASVSGTPQQVEELEICCDDVEPSRPEYSRTVLMCGGLGLTAPPEVKQWQSFTEIYLMENQFTELPEDPRSRVLLALFLNRNYKLRMITPSFFDYMPALEILNLSRTRIKSLPESLFRLSRLKRLFLNHCELLTVLPPKIGELQQLEVLDLEGTEIMDLPKEVAKLTKLTCLEVSFCRCINRGTKSAKTAALIPQGTISALSKLEELSINVNPEDERWENVVEAIVDDVCGLTRLDTLKLYFPQVDHLRKFEWFCIPRWLSHFKFIVGNHDERIMSRLPVDLELEFEYWDRSLRYVNGVGVPINIQNMLSHTTAFFLDRHTDVTKLSDFGIENMEQLKCCIIGECNETQVIIDGTEMYDEADRSEIALETWEDDRRFLGSLEYLYVYRLKSLRSIYEGPLHRGCLSHLKCLVLLTCPQLTTIFTPELLKNLDSLEELKVEDCPLVKSLVRCEDPLICKGTFLPRLKKIFLFSLPELIGLSYGLCIAPNLEQMSIFDCPNLRHPSTDEFSCNHLTVTEAQSIPNDASREHPAPPVVSSTTTGGFRCVRDVTNDTSGEQPVSPGISSTTTSNTAINASVSLKTTSNSAITSSISSKTASKTTINPSTSKLEEEILVTPLLREFSLNDLKLATKNFSNATLLNRGGFGSVFKGCIKENGTGLMVAVKRLKCDWIQGRKEWLAEVKHLGHVGHPNLVNLIGYCIELDERLLVYEFMQRGSLEDQLFKMRSGATLPLSWSTRMKIALDAAKGLAFLHEEAEPKVICRNFKTSKILLDADYNAKLSVLGVGRFYPKGDDSPVFPQTHFATKTIGTYGYAAPEYVATGHLMAKSNVYGFGVVLLEILTGLRVIDQSRPSSQHDLVEWARPSLTKKRELHRLIDPKLERRYSLNGARIASQLVAHCLSHDPRLRPQMSEVVEVLKGLQNFQIRQTSSEIVRTSQGSSSSGMAFQGKPR